MLIASLIIIQVIIFAGLVFMMRKIMTQNVAQATAHLDEMSKENIRKEDELSKRLVEVEQQSSQILRQSQEQADQERLRLIQEAEKEKEKILSQARTQSEEMMQQADKSRQKLLSELDGRIAKEAINKACELIKETLPDRLKQEAHSHWVEELILSDFSQVKSLHIPKDLKEVKIKAAFPLTEKQRISLSKKLKEAIGKDIQIKEEDDPSVVAGLILVLGSLVLDGSLKNKIQEKARYAQQPVGE